MPDPKIRVTADLSGVMGEMAKLEAAAARINRALSRGDLGTTAHKAKAELESLNATVRSLADNIAKTNGVDFSTDTDFAKLTKTLEDAARAGEGLERVLAAVQQPTGLDKSIRAYKAMADNIERVRRAQQSLAREGIHASREETFAAKRRFDEWRASGARGTSKLKDYEFDDWLTKGWSKYSIDAKESERRRRQVMSRLMPGALPPDESMAAGAHRRMGWRFGGGLGGAVAGAAGGIAGSVMAGGEGFFGAMGAAGGAVFGGVLGTVAPGLGTVVGATGGALLGAVGSVIDQSLRRVIAAAETFTDLRHSIGEATTDFDKLRDAVQTNAAGLRLTYEEAAKLARTFSETAGISQTAAQIGQGLGGGVGLSRAYGLPPEAGVQFFGSMLRMGTTATNEQNKRLALLIGEAVAKNGVTPQMGAVLRAVQNFAETTTRASFSQANAAGYADYLSRMMGTGLPGSKDVGAVTNAIAATDAAIRQGGAFGIGSKVFTLGMYQRMLGNGFDAFHLNIMQGRGAFGTVASAFGPGTEAWRNADEAERARYRGWIERAGNKTALQVQLEGIESTWPGQDWRARIMAIQNHLGLTEGQAEAVYKAYQSPGGLGQLQKNMEAAGLSIDKVGTQRFGALAQISGMTREQLRSTIDTMLGDKSVTGDIRTQLEGAKKAEAAGNIEAARGAMMKIAAIGPEQKDEGEIIAQQAIDIKNMTDAVTKQLVPLTSDIQRAMIALLGYFGIKFKAGQPLLDTAKDIGKDIDKATDKAIDKALGSDKPMDILHGIREGLADFERKGHAAIGGIAGNVGRGWRGGGAGGHPDRSKMSAEQRLNMDWIIRNAKAMGANEEETAALLATAWRDSKFISKHGWAPKGATNVPFGLFQVMDKTASGWGLSHESAAAQTRQMRELLAQHRRQRGGTAGARAMGTQQLSGPRNVGAGGYPKQNRRDKAGTWTSDFANEVVHYTEDFLRMPNLTGRLTPPPQQVDVRHQITLIDRNGNPIPNAVTDTTVFGLPQPAGVGAQ